MTTAQPEETVPHAVPPAKNLAESGKAGPRPLVRLLAGGALFALFTWLTHSFLIGMGWLGKAGTVVPALAALVIGGTVAGVAAWVDYARRPKAAAPAQNVVQEPPMDALQAAARPVTDEFADAATAAFRSAERSAAAATLESADDRVAVRHAAVLEPTLMPLPVEPPLAPVDIRESVKSDPKKFTRLFRLQLLAAGPYSDQEMSEHSEEDLAQLRLLGSAVLFATVIAVMSWSVTGFSLFSQSSGLLQLLGTVGIGALGGMMVFIFDRSAIYLFDTQTTINKPKAAAFLAFRVTIVLVIGLMTAQFTMPHWFKNEATRIAQQMSIEERATHVDRERKEMDMTAKEQAAKAAHAEAARLESEAEQVPAAIRTSMRRAESLCAAADGGRSEASKANGGNWRASPQVVRIQAQLTECATRRGEAKRQLDAHTAKASAALTAARITAAKANNLLTDASVASAERLAKFDGVSASTLTPSNPQVLARLLKEDKGALAKWLLLTFLLTTFELLPLLLKLQAGRSPLGASIARRRQVNELREQAAVDLHRLSITGQLAAATLTSAHAGFVNLHQLDELHREAQRSLSQSGKRAAESLAQRAGQRLAGYAVA